MLLTSMFGVLHLAFSGCIKMANKLSSSAWMGEIFIIFQQPIGMLFALQFS